VDWGRLVKSGELMVLLRGGDGSHYADCWGEVMGIAATHAKELATALVSRRSEFQVLKLDGLSVEHFFPGYGHWDEAKAKPILCPVCPCTAQTPRLAAPHWCGKDHIRRITRAQDFLRSVLENLRTPTAESAAKVATFELCTVCGVLKKPGYTKEHDNSKDHVTRLGESVQDDLARLGSPAQRAPRYKRARSAELDGPARAIFFRYMKRNLQLMIRYQRAHYALISEFVTGREVVLEESDDSEKEE
jgi:hypothetical protein